MQKVNAEMIDPRDPLLWLEASKSTLKIWFKDLLNEIKVFKYQITVQVLSTKHKENGELKFTLVYFNSTTNIVTNSEYYIDKSFQDILCRIDTKYQLLMKDLVG